MSVFKCAIHNVWHKSVCMLKRLGGARCSVRNALHPWTTQRVGSWLFQIAVGNGWWGGQLHPSNSMQVQRPVCQTQGRGWRVSTRPRYLGISSCIDYFITLNWNSRFRPAVLLTMAVCGRVGWQWGLALKIPLRWGFGVPIEPQNLWPSGLLHTCGWLDCAIGFLA